VALKKSELYSSLWASCDELRGGMDASQYKDYVLVLLFVKYVSDRYAGQPYAAITIPKGASFSDMVALKGKPDIGDQINKKILGPLAEANQLSDMPDFNDPAKKNALLDAQRAWIKYRDANCAFWDDPAGGQSAAVTAKECILTMTADRASELELANDQ
jgi:type I restriction-modification system DNA methylase subunit